MTGLPESWEVCTFADVTGPVEMVSSSGHDDREINYIDISSIDNRRNRIADPKTLRMKDAPSRARQIVRSGDVLFSTVRPYLRNIAAVPDHLDGQIASTGFAVLRAANGVVPAYLFYKAISRDFVAALTGEQYGVSYPAVKEEQLRSQPFELPPTNEQHRIVAKIEALFSELDAGQDSLTRAQAQLKLYRQSLLKAAFQGRLTADWRKSNADKLETPETLLSRIRTEREARYKQALDDWQTALAEWRACGEVGRKPAKPSRPDDTPSAGENGKTDVVEWVRIPLGGLAYRADLGKMLDQAKNKGTPRPYFGNINLRWGAFNIDEGKTIPIEDHEVERYGICAGDLVICEGGEPGRCAIWTGEDNRYFIQKALHRVRFTGSYLPFFAYYYMIYAAQSGILEKRFTGSTIKHLTGSALAEVPFPLCSIPEQREIIAILEEKLSSVDAIETEITTALAKLSALRQSILKKAFSGQLVPQDPSDEPASALLARLRDTTPTPRRKTKA